MTLREYRQEPCAICGHKGWCSRRDDGLVLCKRPPSPPEVAGYVYKGVAEDGQSGMYVESGKEHKPAGSPAPVAPRRAERPTASGSVLQTTHVMAVAAMTPETRAFLAVELGLPERALSELDIGWSNAAQHHADHNVTGAWVFPEYDGQGRLVGVTYRFPQASVEGRVDSKDEAIGNKSAPAGFRRGLTLPRGWKELSGPILLPEGPSDVLAGLAVELSVIGRPSNTGGVESIAQFCQRRQVIVLGENDRKPDGRWPGKEGAELVARRLEGVWGRPAHVAFPPEGTKDLRDWVRHLAGDWRNVDLVAIRQTILDAVRPPDLLLLARSCDKRGRVEVKVFRSAGAVEAAPIYSDRFHIEEAAARKRFVKAVVKIEPTADTDALHHRLLGLKVPVGSAPKPSSTTWISAAPPPRSDESSAVGPTVVDPRTRSPQLPEVFLPGGSTTILSVGQCLGQLLAQTGKHFSRGGATVTIGRDKDRSPILEPLKSSTLASVFETVAQLMCYVKKDGTVVPEMTICSEQEAKLIQHSPSFQSALPPIYLLSRCPVLAERDGKLVQISSYDRESGILAFGEPVLDVPLDEAVRLLLEMLADFHFATPADRARALAAPITPALVFGNLLGGRAPVDLGEADASQSGKGYRAKLTAAIYRHIVKTVTQKKGGVGSMEENFATALIKGYNFISFDNVRSTIDSPALESFLTEDTFLARVPHLAAIEIDPRRVIVQLTSNRAEITTDLANRSSCVSILKQPEGYRFRKYPEGGILEHIRANQSLYLGAVFAIVKTWYVAGKPRGDATGHDFRPWAGVMDWIVQNVFHAGPLLDGHREMQIRMATPDLNWLRDVTLAVRNSRRMGVWLRAHDLIEIISQKPDTELPGLPEGGDLADEEVKKKVLQAIGRRMALCFNAESVLTIDGFRIARKETADPLNRRPTREYCFQAVEMTPETCDSAPEGYRRTTGAEAAQDAPPAARDQESGSSSEPVAAPDCAYAAPKDAPMGSLIAPMESQDPRVSENTCVISADSREVTGTHRRIGAIGADRVPAPGANQGADTTCPGTSTLPSVDPVDDADAHFPTSSVPTEDSIEEIVDVPVEVMATFMSRPSPPASRLRLDPEKPGPLDFLDAGQRKRYSGVYYSRPASMHPSEKHALAWRYAVASVGGALQVAVEAPGEEVSGA